MDTLLLSRIQFAVTIGVHFLFPPISIGLAWLLVYVEWKQWRGGKEAYLKLGKFFATLLGLTFVMGVATGIVMEFQFGTNWSEYSKFVGDIFGAPLAAEVIFAFFLESGFLGLYLFGRNRVSKGLHWFSILMVAIGATISAFWILVAGSWMQTPSGFVLQNGRAELTSFAEAVFNPSMWPRFFHTMSACFVAGGFFMAGICAYLVRKDNQNTSAREGLKISIIVSLLASLLTAYPTGDFQAVNVAKYQPAKLATMEGLYETQTNAPLLMFGIPDPENKTIRGQIALPGMLSWLAFGDKNAEVQGMDAFPEDELPPLWMTFVSFHNMVMLGSFFIALMGIGVLLIITKKIWTSNLFLKVLVYCIPLPLVAIELGWITAEVGRQPWIVYNIMKTSDAFSHTVPAGQVLFSLIMFSLIYAALIGLYVFLIVKKVKQGPESAAVEVQS